ncbi:MAG: T9SS type A sorting domain-containing protein [Lewinellaceae bacterium]|nr:T9SS type A sorting domain-containing protein [Saprospiraceae bacterium]MCB9333417.1 T9SS type A sorting domain-containing protein [Lewinellaceae bacterium]
MKRISLSTLFSLAVFASQLPAQAWFSNNTVVTYEVSGFFGVADYFNLEVTADTIINGQDCKKISAAGMQFNFVASTQYAYAKSNRVFVYEPVSNTFVKLYDFNLAPGETVLVPSDESQFYYRIDSVQAVQAGPLTLQRQRATFLYENGDPSNWSFDILEGIGMVGNPFINGAPDCSYFFLNNWGFCYSPVDGFDVKFVCVQTDAGAWSPYGYNCQLVDTDTPQPLPELVLQPNPATDQLFLSLETSSVQAHRTVVYSARGQIMQTHTGLPSQLDISGLAPGLYLISIELESGQRLVGRFVKI